MTFPYSDFPILCSFFHSKFVFSCQKNDGIVSLFSKRVNQCLFNANDSRAANTLIDWRACRVRLCVCVLVCVIELEKISTVNRETNTPTHNPQRRIIFLRPSIFLNACFVVTQGVLCLCFFIAFASLSPAV